MINYNKVKILIMAKINTEKLIDYWRKSAEKDHETAEYLLEGKKYSACLFFCHLMIEKILKALVVKETKTHSPYTHKLVDLAKLAKIKLNKRQINNLTTETFI